MEVSKRLQAIAEMVSTGGCVADVGCDHAYTSIYMIEKKLASRVIAMDVKTGPLERAKAHVREYHQQDVIDVRLSDGLAALSPGEVDTILISGMGGALMARLLSDYPNITQSVKELVLQPQSELPKFRQHIHKLGFYLDDEEMIVDEGKIYTIIRAKFGHEQTPYTNEEYLFGRILMRKKSPVWVKFMQVETEKTRKLLDILGQGNTIEQQKRIMELRNYEKALKSGGC